MANKYDSFYLADLEEMIQKMALDKMKPPFAMFGFTHGMNSAELTADDLAFRNSMLAAQNNGVKIMAEAVIAELYKRSEELEEEREAQKREAQKQEAQEQASEAND